MLIVASFVAVLGLSSQSAASWPTYLLALAMLIHFPRWSDVFRLGYFRLILVLVGYLALSTFWSQPFDSEKVARIFLRGMLVLLFVVACAECELRGQLRRWLGRSLAIAATLAACAALYVQFYLPDYFPGNRLHGLGQLDNPVIAGVIFAAGLIVMLDLIREESSPGWIALGGSCAVILLLAIVLTDSRSAWVSAAAGGAVYILSIVVRDRQKFVAVVISMGVLAVVVLTALLMEETTRDLLLPRATSYRMDIWMAVLERVMSENPLFGLGIGTVDHVFVAGYEFNHPHSLYFSVFFQGGLLGLGMFLLLIGWTLRVLLQHYGHADARLALGLFTIAIVGYLLDGHELIDKVSDMWFVFWLPVALAVGLAWRRPAMDADDHD